MKPIDLREMQIKKIGKEVNHTVTAFGLYSHYYKNAFIQLSKKYANDMYFNTVFEELMQNLKKVDEDYVKTKV